MASVICFGPNESYFFNSPSHWSYHNLPPELTNLLMAQPKIRDVHEMALGPNGSYLIVYTDAQGKQMLSHSRLPETLRNWLVPQAGLGVVRDLLTLNVSFDAVGGFFAFDKSSSIRERLPATFEAACRQRMSPQGQWLDGQFPENVSFGPNGAYVMVTRGGGGAWNFNGQLPDLQNFLQQSKSLTGVYPILSPYNSNVHATCFSNGHTWASVPTYCLQQFQMFEADYKAACQRAVAQRASPIQAQPVQVQQQHIQQLPIQQQPIQQQPIQQQPIQQQPIQQQLAHPQQAHPHQIHPQQVHPQQVHPQQVHPQQVHPQQVHSPQAHSPQAHSPQAHPQQVHPQQVHPQQVHPQQVHPQQAHPQQIHPQPVHPQQAHPQQHPRPQQQPHPQNARPQQQAHQQKPGAHPAQGGAQGNNQPSTAQTALQVMKNVNTGLKLMNNITGALTGGNTNNNSGGGFFPGFNFNTSNNN